jgi:hypothetical protein
MVTNVSKYTFVRMKKFPLDLTDQEHATIQRRAKAAGLPMYKYIKAMAIDGRINKKPK